MSRPPIDLAAIDTATKEAMAAGHRIFQTHRYGPGDDAHVSFLLDIMRPKAGGIVVDAGCGIGEVSRLMGEMQPDLAFVLVNLSEYQLSHCPAGEQFMALQGDCHALEINDDSADAIMFSSALCQMDADAALAEAFRVLKDGGVLLVNEMVRVSDGPQELEKAIAARVPATEELLATVERAGFEVDVVKSPDYDASHFKGMLEAHGIGHLFEGVFPLIIRAIARKTS